MTPFADCAIFDFDRLLATGKYDPTDHVLKVTDTNVFAELLTALDHSRDSDIRVVTGYDAFNWEEMRAGVWEDSTGTIYFGEVPTRFTQVIEGGQS